MTVASPERRAEPSAPHFDDDNGPIPFNAFEEIWQLRDPPDETANIHLELRLSGALDAECLDEAIRAAVAVHPMARARQVAKRVFLRPPRWRIGGAEPEGVLQSIDCRDESDVAAARTEFYDRPISLLRAPALRFLVAHRAGGDTLMFNAHHAITDGVGALRFLHSVARAYAGRPDPVPAIDPLAARAPGTAFGPVGQRRSSMAKPPAGPTGVRAFVAPEGERPGSGFGFLHLTLRAELSRQLNPRRFAHSATVNDLLNAALHLAIADWNARRNRPCDCIAIFMPANSRPMEWRNELVINYTVGAKVVSTPEQRADPAALMAAITQQTQWIKSGAAAAAALGRPAWLLNLTPILLPVISFLMGDRVENTAVLSNLGRLDELPDFGAGAGAVTEFAFSPPCGMPMGLSIGVAGVRGGLHFAFRYRRALFDDRAARRFADIFLERLRRLGQEETSRDPDRVMDQ